ITDSLQIEVLKAGFQQVLSFRPQEIQSLKLYGKSIVVEVDSTYCHGLKRKHSSNRAYLVISTSTVTQKCHDPDCKDNVASMVRTHMDKFPVAFRNVVLSLLEPTVKESSVLPAIASELVKDIIGVFDFQLSEIGPVSTSESGNGLVAKIMLDSGVIRRGASFMGSLYDGARLQQHSFICPSPSLEVRTNGEKDFELLCPNMGCTFRDPQRLSSFHRMTQPSVTRRLGAGCSKVLDWHKKSVHMGKCRPTPPLQIPCIPERMLVRGRKERQYRAAGGCVEWGSLQAAVGHLLVPSVADPLNARSF
ncbi:hypothetical protein HDU81_009198, partial [Chytriomyces hyalinus]